MLTKDSMIKEFSKDYKKHYEVDLFRQKGFVRKSCVKCSKNFWTLDTERKTCADSTCEPYGFINNTITKDKWDYTETWKLFEKFFVKNGHESIPRYPVIDRVRPDLYFTIASIQDFQRIDNGNMSFVYPANPLIVPQVCLRFIDIPSVGVSGRHLTSFVMPGQHAFNHPQEGYFKDRCMELDFDFFTKSMGIPEKELVYAEDVWMMPGAFGPSVETFSKGVELVNHVFMQYQPAKTGYKQLDMLVNDTGWGLERLVWFSNGTETMYDSIFGKVIDKLKKDSGVLIDTELFSRYSEIAGVLDVSELQNVEKVREEIAKKLNTETKFLKQGIEPLQAIYAITDHIRTLLFAVSDGGFPSNIGGGYNLRVILRRAFSFMNRYNFDFDLTGIAEHHAKHLKKMYPELSDGLENFSKIIDIEKEKYGSSKENAKKIVLKMVEKNEKFDDDRLVQLYESNGITPELIRDIAKVDVSDNVYSKITEKHESKEEEKQKLSVAGLPPTELLFYKDSKQKEFKGKVLKIINNKHVILDKTLFYARSGGQDCDTGILGGSKVFNVEKIGNVVVHDVDKPKFREGAEVSGTIDMDRRTQLMKHHTAIHVLNAAARKILGNHIWQAGTEKTMEKAHLDVTHYRPITQEELDKIEVEANKIIEKGKEVKAVWLPRAEAEKKYGLSIYQGGLVPGKEIRILEIPDWDIEACGGTHLDNTKEIGRILVLGSERIQDGRSRITIMSGARAEKYLDDMFEKAKLSAKMIIDLSITEYKHDLIKSLKRETAYKELQKCAKFFSVSVNEFEKTIQKFTKEIEENKRDIDTLSEKLWTKREQKDKKKPESLYDACEFIFDFWKEQRKKLELLTEESSKKTAEGLMSKVRDNQLVDILKGDRKELIGIANQLIEKEPKLTVILANHAGDIVCKTQTKDAAEVLTSIVKQAGGSGGGTKEFAQGRVEISKLLKVIEKMK